MTTEIFRSKAYRLAVGDIQAEFKPRPENRSVKSANSEIVRKIGAKNSERFSKAFRILSQ